MNRAVAVMKMHLVDRLTLVALPLGILTSAFVVNVLVWLPLGTDDRKTGGALSVFFFVLAAAIFAVVRGLPFALGMGSTRRSFILGTAMTGGVISLGFGTLYLVLQRVEDITDGWWMNGTFFDYGFFARSAWPARWLMLVMTFAACWLLGTAIAALWPRWGMLSVAIGLPAVTLIGGGAFALLAWQGWWGSVGTWFGDLTPLTATGWLAVAALALAVATWGSLRRVSNT